MLKYLTRAMNALTPRSAYDIEIEGRRKAYREQVARQQQTKQAVAEARARGDRVGMLRAAQPGLREDQTERERRLAEVYADDDLLFAKVEREHADSVANFAAAQAATDDELARRRYIFAKQEDEAEFLRMFNAGETHAAITMLRGLIADGMVIDAVLPR